MDLVYESDVVNFYIEQRGPKLYLHTEVKKWSKSSLKHGIAVIAELGEKLGELYTYSPTLAAHKLALISGFQATQCSIPSHWDANIMVEEYRLERYFGEYEELIALGIKAHELIMDETYEHNLDHETPAHNFAVGLLVSRIQAHQPEYAEVEYNRWASRNGYATVTVDGYSVTVDDILVEVPPCQ